MKKVLLIIILVLAVPLNCFAENGVTSLYHGELKGSKILIAEPSNWNKKILIIAHGHRSLELPVTAEFPYDGKFYKTLIDEGWIVASTSYRHNGFIPDEAFEDLDYLREFVIEKYGRPSKIYLEGFSGGSAVATLISEKYPEKYDGILAVCPVLGFLFEVNNKPMIPIVFLSNQDEVATVTKYLANLDKSAVTPGFWVVKRDGHCIKSADEELLAFRATVDHSEKKPIEMRKDILMGQADRPSVALFKDGGAYSTITRLHPSYGNLDTEFVPADVKRMGIEKGDKFTVRYGDNEYKVPLESTYSDVSKGEWVAFFAVDGYLKIARNFANAAELLGCKEGDMILIKK